MSTWKFKRCPTCKGSGYTSKPSNSDHCCETCGTAGKIKVTLWRYRARAWVRGAVQP
jgi:DnaJ-class molecular chaperone